MYLFFQLVFESLFELFQLRLYHVRAVGCIPIEVEIILVIILCLIERALGYDLGDDRVAECAFLLQTRLVVFSLFSLFF